MGGGLEEADQAHPNAAPPGRTIPEDITNPFNVKISKLVNEQKQPNIFCFLLLLLLWVFLSVLTMANRFQVVNNYITTLSFFVYGNGRLKS